MMCEIRDKSKQKGRSSVTRKRPIGRKRVRIREEQQSDFDEIYRLVKKAFESTEKADGDEQDYVLKLRAGTGYIPQLALVAEDGGKLIGHIMLTKTYIETENGSVDTEKGSIVTEKKSVEALLLSPLAVLPEYRNKGVGASLVREALARANVAGYIAVFLCGDPKYYGCFGFIPVDNYNISYDMDVPRQMCWGANWLRGG